MANWIRLENNVVVETTDTDPKGRFHPDLKWVKAALSVQPGMVKATDGTYELPSAAPEYESHPSDAQRVTSITKLTFMNRFTMEELAGIYTAAKSEVMVEVFLDKLKLAEHIELTDSNTIAGVQALAAGGLLTEVRAVEVLK